MPKLQVRLKLPELPISSTPISVTTLRDVVRMLENGVKTIRDASKFLPDKMDHKVEKVAIAVVE